MKISFLSTITILTFLFQVCSLTCQVEYIDVVPDSKFIEYAFQDYSSGFSEKKAGKHFAVYPNPASSVLCFKPLGEKPNLFPLRITILNNIGEIIERNQIINLHECLNIENYPAGIYHCIIQKDEKSIETISFIVL